MSKPQQDPLHPADKSRKSQPEAPQERPVRPSLDGDPDPDEPPGTKTDREL